MRACIVWIGVLVVLGASGARAQEDPDVLVPEGEPEEIAQGLYWARMGAVQAVAFSPDGRWLATGSSDGVVRLWDIASGREHRSLLGHSDSVETVAFSPDGRWLASGSSDDTVKLWDVASGREIRSFQGHSGPVSAVAFTPDGRRLASGSDDNTVRLWDVKTGHVERSFAGHSNSVNAVAFSPDGRWLASGSRDNTVKLWDVTTGHEKHSSRGYSGGVAFSPDGRWFASGSDDNTVKLRDVTTGREARSITGHSDWISAVAFSPDGRWLASGAFDNTVRLWDVASGREMRSLKGHWNWVNAVEFSADGRWLASGSDDGTARLWDVASGREARSFHGNSRPGYELAFSSDDRLLASASLDISLRLWDIATGRETRSLQGLSSPVSTLAFSHDGRWLASGSLDSTVELRDFTTYGKVRSLRSGDTTTMPSSVVTEVAFSPDSRWLASGSYGGTVKLWDLTSGGEAPSLDLRSPVLAMAFSPGSRWLASGSYDRLVRLWDVTSREVRSLRGHSGSVSGVAFSPNGRWLASGSTDHTVRLWDVVSGRQVRSFPGHSGSVSEVAFSPKGQWLASGSTDRTVRLWDVSSGHELGRWPMSEKVHDITFSHDGAYLGIGLEAGAQLRSVKDGKLVAELHSMGSSWYGYRAGQRVYRKDDGRMLYRRREDGALESVPPPAPGTPARLTASTTVSTMPGDDGEVGELVARITNDESGGRAYWISVVPASDLPPGLALLPPTPHMRLEPGRSVEIPVGLSFLSPREGTKPHDAEVRLKVLHAHGEGPTISTNVHIRSPILTTRFERTGLRSVAAILLNEGDQATGPLTVTGMLSDTPAPEQKLDPIGPGKTRTVSLAIPDDLVWRWRLPLSLSIRSERWPLRTFQRIEDVSMMALYTPFASALIVAFAMAGFVYYVRVYRHPVVVGLNRHPEKLKEIPLAQLPEVDRALGRARQKSQTLTMTMIPEARWLRVIKAAGSSEDAASAFAEAVGGTLGPLLAEDAWALTLPPLRLRFAEQAAVLVTDGRRLEDGNARRRVADILRAGAGPSKVLILDRTDAQNAASVLKDVPGTTFAVLSSNVLRDLLLDEHPVQKLEATIASQVAISELSPYRTAGGVDAETFFFGRERELRTIVDQRLRNFLVVGPRQIGKSTLLKALHRRLKARADVEVHYLVLGGPDLARQMVAHLAHGRPHDGAPPPFEELAAGLKERPRVWLVDEADEFIAAEARAEYPTLRSIRALAEEGRAYFVFAGFWDLYRAAVFDETGPLRNFGETIRLPPLDPDASVRLVTEPMGALGLAWDSNETTAHLLEQTGRRANLLVLACKGMIESLPADTRTLTRAHLERVLKADPDLRDQSRRWRGETPLHRAVVRQALLLGRPSRDEIRRELQGRGALVSGHDFDRVLDHIELSYVLIPDAEGRLYCPVPLMQRYIEAERPLELGLEEDLENLARKQPERAPTA